MVTSHADERGPIGRVPVHRLDAGDRRPRLFIRRPAWSKRPRRYLAKQFHVVDLMNTIRDPRNKAFVKVKTFDMKVMTGSKPIRVLIDELHVMAVDPIRGADGRANPRCSSNRRRTRSCCSSRRRATSRRPACSGRNMEYARGVRAGRLGVAHAPAAVSRFREAGM